MKNKFCDPAKAERVWYRPNPGIEGCWAIAWLKIPHLTPNQCSFRARPGKLTCGTHKKLEREVRNFKMKGKLKVVRPRYGSDESIPIGTRLRDASREFITTARRILKRRRWWWPFGKTVEIEVIREDRNERREGE